MSNVVSILSRRPPGSPAPLSDSAARLRALDPTASFIVEAPAGSGKTGLLVQRFLTLLAHDSVAAPEEVLAITFTNKATAELRERILQQLASAASGDDLPTSASAFDQQTRALASTVLERDRALGWSLLDRPAQLNVRSIDSVNAEIARSLPLLSGGGSRQPVPDAVPLYREAARRTLAQLGGPDRTLHNALYTVLLHRDGSLADCETLLARMLAAREQWGELVPLGPGALDDESLDREVRPRLERSLEAVVCAALTRALRCMPAGLLERLTTFAARLGLEPGYNGKLSPISLCAGRHDPPAAVAEHLDHWTALIGLLLKPSDGGWRASFTRNHIGFEIPKNDAAWLKQTVAQLQSDSQSQGQSEDLREALCAVRCLPPSRYPDEQWHVARALFHLLRHALAELKLLFAERGECDFSEIALSAREALHADYGPADFASTPAGRLQHLLVDEMQDTSSGQYELLHRLTRSWDGHSQTLFLVGDPKQSIYLFRQARVERFLRTMRERRLGDLPSEPLRLTANFRSQAALVEELNGVFTAIFPAPDAAASNTAAVDVPFTPAAPTRLSSASPALQWHLEVPAARSAEPETPEDDSASATAAAAAARRGEAVAVRRTIERCQASPLPPGRSAPWRIAVLARTRNHLADIVAELKNPAHGNPIAFHGVEIDPLAERPEVLDALALTRALLHPADRVAWLAVLHAPWCGLGLADLLTLTDEGPAADPGAPVSTLVASRRHLLSAAAEPLLARCWPTLETAVAQLGRAPFAVQVERTWLSLGGDAPLSPEQRTNARRFFALLRELELDSGLIDIDTLSARLSRLYAEPASGELAVELLTIHKAKGLEWDIVIVPGLHRGEPPNAGDLLNWLELDGDASDAAHVLLAPIWSKGEDSDRLNQWIRSVRAAREAAERKRLLYVAATRAREGLHLFGAANRKQNGEFAKPNASSLLAACWPAVLPVFEREFGPPALNLPAGPPIAEDLHARLLNSLRDDAGEAPLTLAASAEADDAASSRPPDALAPPLIHRLPLRFDPLARFHPAASDRLPYPAAATLPQSRTFDRPEGSFAVRAFGNVVHRYLQVLCTRLASGTAPEDLLSELAGWQPRLLASLCGEGLPPALAAREAGRILQALERTLNDPAGRWILSPHPDGSTEREITSAHGSLRADRIFAAGPPPGQSSTGSAETRLWIVDFKTTEPGNRSEEAFAAAELAKYRPQLEAYAVIVHAATAAHRRPLSLGLYYPLASRLLHWHPPSAEA